MNKHLWKLVKKCRPSNLAATPAFQHCTTKRHYIRPLGGHMSVGVKNEMEDEVEKAYKFSDKQPDRRKSPPMPPPSAEWEDEEEDEVEGEDDDKDLNKYLNLRRSTEEEEPDAEFSTDDEFELQKIMESKRPLDEKGRRMWEYRDPKQLPHSVEELQNRLTELLETESELDPRVAAVRLKLAMELNASEDPDAYRAVSLGKDALKAFGIGSNEEGLCFYVIGVGYRRMGEYELGLSFLRRALDFFEDREAEGKQVGWDKRMTLNELGHTLVALGKTEEAIEHYHDAIDLLESLLKPGSAELADEYKKLAEVCCKNKQWNDAKINLENAIRIHSKAEGHDSVEVAEDRRLLSVAYMGLEKHEKALEELRICRQIYLDGNVGGYKGAFLTTLEIAETLMKLKRYNEAVANLEGATVPKKYPVLKGLIFIELARAYVLKNNFEESRKQLNNALEFYKLHKGELNQEELVSVMMKIATIFNEIGDKEECLSTMKEALNACRIDPSSDKSVNIKIQIGNQLVKYGRHEEALVYYKESLEGFEKMGLVSVEVLMLTAKVYMELSKHGAALELLEKARVEVDDASKAQGSKKKVVPERLPVYRALVQAYIGAGRHWEAIHEQEAVVEQLLSLKRSGHEVEDELKKEMEFFAKLASGKQGEN